jgi:hypothetical protein
MSIDLPACVDGGDVDHPGLPVHGERDSPLSDAALAGVRAFAELGGESGIAGVVRELAKTPGHSPSKRAIHSKQPFLGLVGQRDAVRHRG